MTTVDQALQTRELLSALADGALRGEAFKAAMEGCCQDEALASWGTYHLIGEMLRQPSVVAPRAHMDFLGRLNERFEREQVVLAVAFSADRYVPAAAQPRAVPVADVVDHRGSAANDSNVRWKLLAGFASLAAVSAIAWNAVGLTGSSAAPQLAQAVAG